MNVAFNEIMTQRNITAVDKSKLKIEIIQEQFYGEEDQGPLVSEIKEWNCSIFEKQMMQFHLNFTNFANVSFYSEDQVRMTVLDSEFFKMEKDDLK